jgi:hypothetical protein
VSQVTTQLVQQPTPTAEHAASAEASEVQPSLHNTPAVSTASQQAAAANTQVDIAVGMLQINSKLRVFEVGGVVEKCGLVV